MSILAYLALPDLTRTYASASVSSSSLASFCRRSAEVSRAGINNTVIPTTLPYLVDSNFRRESHTGKSRYTHERELSH
ncbi:hypothetical protein PENSPDRAFT_654958 [Peniophora sp. CONT]|nr:hypothetical protein PENSPDRAFT_654958 [Peniophora sp. CONT]